MNVAEYLASLGYNDGEHVGLFWKTNDYISSAVIPSEWASIYFDHKIPVGADAYLAPNPVRGPARKNAGRGKVEDVHAVRALYADIDVKPGACRDLDQAHQLVDDIASLLQERPTVVIHSGGGLQPIWSLEDTDPDLGARILRRFGRLVRVCADARGVAIDSVFDLARVLRAPGTLNHKYDPPVEAACVPDSGGPMTADQVRERLDEAGILDITDDTGLGAEIIEHPDDCAWSLQPCNYIKTLIAAWNTEEVQDRHPWLLCQFVRLECARRYGCLTHDAYNAAMHVLETRMHALCGRPGDGRRVGTHEIRDIRIEAINRASRKTNDQVASELGRHRHNLPNDKPSANGHHLHVVRDTDEEPPEPLKLRMPDYMKLENGFWDSRQSLRTIYEHSLARMTPPWSVLACCVARALTYVPPHIFLPPIVGGPGTLNWFGALISVSGGGKSTSLQASEALVNVYVQRRNVGSGEGVIAAYKTRTKNDEDDPATKAVMFVADEIDTLTALGSRTGSTLLPTLRTAFSGDDLGFGYKENVNVAARTYRTTLICSMQPGRAGPIINDAEGGTPQRFMWFPANDMRIGDTDNRDVDPCGLTLPRAEDLSYPTILSIPPEAEEAVRENRILQARGETDEMKGHSIFSREKFAYALTILDGRTSMTSEDWRLSGIAASVSDFVLQWVMDELENAKLREAENKGRSHGVFLAASAEGKQEHDCRTVARVADAVMRMISRSATVTGRDLARSVTSKDRRWLDVALTELESDGRVEQSQGPRGGVVWTVKK